MTIAPYESIGGRPVELFVFDVNGTTYRYTSADEIVTLVAVNDPSGNPLDGDYLMGAVSRDAIAQTDEPGNASVVVRLHRSTELARVFSQDRAPDTVVLVRVYRYQRDDVSQEVIAIFDGEAAGFSGQDNMLELRCTPEQAVISRIVPAYVMKSRCNNVLFDTMCALDRATFAVAGTMDAISLTGGTITVTAASAQPDGYFANGEVVSADGTRRDIIAHTGDQLVLIKPFPEGLVAIGDALTLYPGCDGTYTTCDVKFNNVPNFFGFDLIPVDDPFKSPQQ